MRLPSARGATTLRVTRDIIPLTAWDDTSRIVWTYSEAALVGTTDTTHSEGERLNGGPSRVFAPTDGGFHIATFTAPMDLSDADALDFLVDVDDPDKLSSCRFEFADDDTFDNRLTVWCHPVLRKLMRGGEQWARVTIRRTGNSTTTGTPDLTAVTHMRVRVAARTGEDVTVRIGAVRKASIGRGVVVMDFDDAIVSQYEEAFPVMQQYGLTGNLGVITGVVGTSLHISGHDHHYQTWEQIAELHDAGWPVVSHTHTHPALGSVQLATAQENLLLSHEALRAAGYEFGSRILICPYDSYSLELSKWAENPMRVVRWSGAVNLEPEVADFPQSHPGYQEYRGPVMTDEDRVNLYTGWIDEAISWRGLLTFGWHEVVSTPSPDGYLFETPTDEFAQVCAYIRSKIDAGELLCLNRYDMVLGGLRPTRVGPDRWLARRGDETVILDLS